MIYVYLAEQHSKPLGNTQANSNAIQVRADYWKGTGLVVGFTGVEHTKGDSLGNFRYMPIGSPSDRVIADPTMSRMNAKKLQTVTAEINASIKTKSGKWWEEVVKFAEKHGMKLETEAIAVAE